MVEYLEPELRELAIKGQEEYWQTRMDPSRRKRVLRRSGSEYLLTGLVVAKQGGEPLTGVLCGRPSNRIRYYRHRRGAREYQKGSIFNRMFLAEPLEQAVVAFVQAVLSHTDDLADRINRSVTAQLAQMSADGEDLIALRQKREAVRKRLEFVVANLDPATLAEATGAISRIRQELQSIDQQIATKETASAMQSLDPALIASRVRERCLALTSGLADCPKHQLRELLRLIVDRIIVDMETKSFEIHLALPNWIMEDAPACTMRPGTNSQSSTRTPTHPLGALKMALGDCHAERRRGKPCYRCQRRAA